MAEKNASSAISTEIDGVTDNGSQLRPRGNVAAMDAAMEARIDSAVESMEFRSERTLNDKFAANLIGFGIDPSEVESFLQNFEYEMAGFVSPGKTPQELNRIGLEADAFSIQVEIEEIQELLEETALSAHEDEKEFMRRRIQKLRDQLDQIDFKLRGVNIKKKEKAS